MALKDKLAGGDFVITAEITPPLGASADAVMARAEPLRGLADAVNITDGAGARAAMSSISCGAVMVREGLEPIMQLTCRDRNRIGLASDLLGASALGVHNMLVLHGDDPKGGDMPEATGVYDLDSRGVMNLARMMRDEGKLPSDREINPRPDFFIACADMPMDPKDDWEPKGLAGKIESGAEFAQTQFCFDIGIAERYFARLREHGITDRLKFIVGIGPLASGKQARFMDENLFGVSVPGHIIDRIESADDEKAEGRKICVELMEAYQNIEGIAGVHIMAPMQGAKAIAETIRMSGMR
ncbi:MAG: methylenetetrahydrofolate reductase [Pseudomonadota bacterium]